MPLDINLPCPPVPFHQAATQAGTRPVAPLDTLLARQTGATAASLPSVAEEMAWAWFVADFKQQVFCPDPDDPAACPGIDTESGW